MSPHNLAANFDKNHLRNAIEQQLSHSSQIVSHYGVIKVQGEDARKFLQGQITCDVEKVSANSATLGAFCNVQGRMHAIFYLLEWQGALLMIMPKAVLPHALQKLSMYAVFFQAELSDASQDYVLSTHLGQLNLASSLLGDQRDMLKDFSLSVSTTATELRMTLADSGISLSLSTAEEQTTNDAPTSSYWDFLQSALGIPMVYESTIEQLLPHFVGLPKVGGVGFEKGCYTGQEVIARMHYRGTLKTHPALLASNSKPTAQAGDTLFTTIAAEESEGSPKKAGELIHISSISLNTENESTLSLALVCLNDKFLAQTCFQLDGQKVALITAVQHAKD